MNFRAEDFYMKSAVKIGTTLILFFKNTTKHVLFFKIVPQCLSKIVNMFIDH
jgi:hypothetical protein